MIKEALDKAEALGATALSTDNTPGSQRVTVLDAEGPNHKATKALSSHVFYLTAVLGTHERIELTEVRRLMGYRVERAPTYREQLMERAGWPEATLTIEELERLL